MKLIIDTDPGVDDAMAIFYAALAPDIELLGLTSVFGNVRVDQATRNALVLAEMAGQNIPVAEGAAKPLMLPEISPSVHVHGAEGFGDILAQTPKGRALDESAAEFLCRMARQHKGELVVCPIGPITNIAEAIKLDPEFAKNVKKIVFMGGAAFVKGNITEHAEANTYHDPHALNLVINSGADVLMVGLDVTMQALCKADYFEALAKASPKLGGFLQDASYFYLKFYQDVAGVAGCGLHDPAAVIACTNPELFKIEHHPITTIEEGEQIGKTVVTSDESVGKIGICVDGDMDAVMTQFSNMFGA